MGDIILNYNFNLIWNINANAIVLITYIKYFGVWKVCRQSWLQVVLNKITCFLTFNWFV